VHDQLHQRKRNLRPSPDVAYVLFGDGSVRALRDTIAPLTIVSLVTSMRGDTIDPNAL
jgi:hypothetical protein